jgi:hypothetical protein
MCAWKDTAGCTSPVSNRCAMFMFGRGNRIGALIGVQMDEIAGKMRAAMKEQFALNGGREGEDEDLEETSWEE